MINYQNSPDFYSNTRVYAGIDTSSFNTVYAKQNLPNLCWAACIEMISRYYGFPVAQEYFAKTHCGVDAWGNAKDCPASVDVITRNLNRRFVTHSIKTPIYWGRPNPNVLFNLLKNDTPVIIAYDQGASVGHAVLLTGISYDETIWGNELSSVIVRDPAPDILNQIFLGRKEYNQNPNAFLNTVYAWWVPSVWQYDCPRCIH